MQFATSTNVTQMTDEHFVAVIHFFYMIFWLLGGNKVRNPVANVFTKDTSYFKCYNIDKAGLAWQPLWYEINDKPEMEVVWKITMLSKKRNGKFAWMAIRRWIGAALLWNYIKILSAHGSLYDNRMGPITGCFRHFSWSDPAFEAFGYIWQFCGWPTSSQRKKRLP